jgi:hypothetical protein
MSDHGQDSHTSDHSSKVKTVMGGMCLRKFPSLFHWGNCGQIHYLTYLYPDLRLIAPVQRI